MQLELTPMELKALKMAQDNTQRLGELLKNPQTVEDVLEALHFARAADSSVTFLESLVRGIPPPKHD